MKDLTSSEDFTTDDEVIDYTGSTSDEDVTVSTGAGTLPGNYDTEVTQLAEIEKNRGMLLRAPSRR